MVDEFVGAAHRELEFDYLRRKDALDPNVQRGIEARLQTLRASWTLLLDRVP